MIVTAEIRTGQLADLIKQVRAGDEVLLTQGNKPVAKLISAVNETIAPMWRCLFAPLRATGS